MSKNNGYKGLDETNQRPSDKQNSCERQYAKPITKENRRAQIRRTSENPFRWYIKYDKRKKSQQNAYI